MLCPDQDPETGECMRRLTRCRCNPPRCYVCGRFISDWNDVHADCDIKVQNDLHEQLRRDVEEQGMIY